MFINSLSMNPFNTGVSSTSRVDQWSSLPLSAFHKRKLANPLINGSHAQRQDDYQRAILVCDHFIQQCNTTLGNDTLDPATRNVVEEQQRAASNHHKVLVNAKRREASTEKYELDRVPNVNEAIHFALRLDPIIAGQPAPELNNVYSLVTRAVEHWASFSNKAYSRDALPTDKITPSNFGDISSKNPQNSQPTTPIKQFCEHVDSLQARMLRLENLHRSFPYVENDPNRNHNHDAFIAKTLLTELECLHRELTTTAQFYNEVLGPNNLQLRQYQAIEELSHALCGLEESMQSGREGESYTALMKTSGLPGNNLKIDYQKPIQRIIPIEGVDYPALALEELISPVVFFKSSIQQHQGQLKPNEFKVGVEIFKKFELEKGCTRELLSAYLAEQNLKRAQQGQPPIKILFGEDFTDSDRKINKVVGSHLIGSLFYGLAFLTSFSLVGFAFLALAELIERACEAPEVGSFKLDPDTTTRSEEEAFLENLNKYVEKNRNTSKPAPEAGIDTKVPVPEAGVDAKQMWRRNNNSANNSVAEVNSQNGERTPSPVADAPSP